MEAFQRRERVVAHSASRAATPDFTSGITFALTCHFNTITTQARLSF